MIPDRKQGVFIKKTASQLLESLSQYDAEGLAPEAAVSLSLIQQDLRRKAENKEAYPFYSLLAIPEGRLYQTPFRLSYAHQIGNQNQAEAYLQKIRNLGTACKRMDQANQGIKSEYYPKRSPDSSRSILQAIFLNCCRATPAL